MLEFKVVAVFCLFSSVSAMVNTIQPLVDKWWTMTNKTGSANNIMEEEQFEQFFKRYESQSDEINRVNVRETDFMSGPQNWIKDFNTSAEFTKAYFRLLANFDADSPNLLTQDDCRLMHGLCDVDSFGEVNETEFKQNMFGLLRALPYGMMFLRFDTNPQDEYLDSNEVTGLFNAWDADGNGAATSSEFLQFWSAGKYGDNTSGQNTFNYLDSNDDGVIDQQVDIQNLYTELDNNDDGLFSFEEYANMDTRINGFPLDP